MRAGGGGRAIVARLAGRRCAGWSILGLLCLALLPACSKPVPQLPPLADDAVVLAFGDSLTYGTGAGPDASYPAQLARLSGRTVINAGVPGELAGEGLERLGKVLDQHAPQLLILCHGGNDLLHKRDFASIETALERMVALSHARGVPVLLLGVPRPALFGLDSAAFYGSLADRLQLPLEAEVIPEILSQRDLKSDQIHPNAEGYRRMAQAVFGLLQRSGAL